MNQSKLTWIYFQWHFDTREIHINGFILRCHLFLNIGNLFIWKEKLFSVFFKNIGPWIKTNYFIATLIFVSAFDRRKMTTNIVENLKYFFHWKSFLIFFYFSLFFQFVLIRIFFEKSIFFIEWNINISLNESNKKRRRKKEKIKH